MLKNIWRIILVLATIELYAGDCLSTIFVPRQLSYNPILENSTLFEQLKIADDWSYALSIKPIYTQNVGNAFNCYFTIDHKPVMSVEEDGSGDIDPLWFKVLSSDDTFYSSTLCFSPKRRTYGSLLFFEAKLPRDFFISVNTALVGSQNDLHMREANILHPGIGAYKTVAQSLASSARKYGRVCDASTKVGLDDIQVKLIKNVLADERGSWDIYGLLGIPTGAGSKAHDLFEPLIGSKHAQLGLGTNYYKECYVSDTGSVALLGEVKWRYGFAGTEQRIFDLADNGQWSRYLLFVDESAKSATYFASNELAFETKVTPRNSLDVYLAVHGQHRNWHGEIGYDFWFRQQEKVQFACSCFPEGVGIADLVGIAALNPQSASTANISQSVEPGDNQIVSDTTFIPVTVHDVNLSSGAAPQSISNSLYASIAYDCSCKDNPMQLGLSAAYELGHTVNVPDNVYVWLNFNLSF